MRGDAAERGGSAERGAGLAALDIVVAVARDESGQGLLRELQRTRARVRHLWPLTEPLPEDCDVVFCEASAEVARLVPWPPGQPTAALVMVVSPTTDLDVLRRATPDAVLHRPFSAQAVLAGLTVAHANFTYASRLRQRIQKLDETSRTIRSVERAKTMLMQSRRMREEEAYRFIRNQAMTRRISIGAFASAIVESGDALG